MARDGATPTTVGARPLNRPRTPSVSRIYLQGAKHENLHVFVQSPTRNLILYKFHRYLKQRISVNSKVSWKWLGLQLSWSCSKMIHSRCAKISPRTGTFAVSDMALRWDRAAAWTETSPRTTGDESSPLPADMWRLRPLFRQSWGENQRKTCQPINQSSARCHGLN